MLQAEAAPAKQEFKVEEFIHRRFKPDEHWFTGNCY